VWWYDVCFCMRFCVCMYVLVCVCVCVCVCMCVTQELTEAVVRLLTGLLRQNAEGKREFWRAVPAPTFLSLLLPLASPGLFSTSAPLSSATSNAAGVGAVRALPAAFWAAAPDAELLRTDLAAGTLAPARGGDEPSASDSVPARALRPRLSLALSAARGRRAAVVGQTFGLEAVASVNLLATAAAAATTAGSTGGASGVSAADGAGSGTIPAEAERLLAAFVPAPMPAARRAAALAEPADATGRAGGPWAWPWEGLVAALVAMLLDTPAWTPATDSVGTEVVGGSDALPVRAQPPPRDSVVVHLRMLRARLTLSAVVGRVHGARFCLPCTQPWMRRCGPPC
jgi:hypothetical protein